MQGSGERRSEKVGASKIMYEVLKIFSYRYSTFTRNG